MVKKKVVGLAIVGGGLALLGYLAWKAKAETQPPSCLQEGEVDVITYCPDGATPESWRVCQPDGTWGETFWRVC